MRNSGLILLLVLLLGVASCGDRQKVEKEYDENGKLKSEKYFIDDHELLIKEYWDNGNLKSELHKRDSLLDGVSKWYLPSGKLQLEATYKDNKLNGPIKRWYENGNIMEESWYKDGVQDSITRSYSINGVLIYETHYADGKLNGELKRWFENGQVFQDGQYVDGMMDGSWFVFYSDGNLAATADFKMGTGKQTSYEHSGYKCLVTNYVDNEKHGKEIHYNPDGKVARVANYEYGEWIGDD